MNKELKGPKKTQDSEFDQVCQTAIAYVEQSRQNVLRSVNHEQTVAYWRIGQLIVEAEQQGKNRAAYGAELLKTLSINLTKKFNRGFSLTNLKYMR